MNRNKATKYHLNDCQRHTLKKLRVNKKIAAETLSTSLNKSKAWVGQIERGRITSIKEHELVSLLAALYGMSSEDIINGGYLNNFLSLFNPVSNPFLNTQNYDDKIRYSYNSATDNLYYTEDSDSITYDSDNFDDDYAEYDDEEYDAANDIKEQYMKYIPDLNTTYSENYNFEQDINNILLELSSNVKQKTINADTKTQQAILTLLNIMNANTHYDFKLFTVLNTIPLWALEYLPMSIQHEKKQMISSLRYDLLEANSQHELDRTNEEHNNTLINMINHSIPLLQECNKIISEMICSPDKIKKLTETYNKIIFLINTSIKPHVDLKLQLDNLNFKDNIIDIVNTGFSQTRTLYEYLILLRGEIQNNTH